MKIKVSIILRKYIPNFFESKIKFWLNLELHFFFFSVRYKIRTLYKMASIFQNSFSLNFNFGSEFFKYFLILYHGFKQYFNVRIFAFYGHSKSMRVFKYSPYIVHVKWQADWLINTQTIYLAIFLPVVYVTSSNPEVGFAFHQFKIDTINLNVSMAQWSM